MRKMIGALPRDVIALRPDLSSKICSTVMRDLPSSMFMFVLREKDDAQNTTFTLCRLDTTTREFDRVTNMPYCRTLQRARSFMRYYAT